MGWSKDQLADGGAFASLVGDQLKANGLAQGATSITAATATVANDPSSYYNMNSASAQTLTIPSGLSKWPIGSVITAIQMGAGALTIAAGSGVTLLNNTATKGQYTVYSLIKTDTNTYLVKAG